LFYHAGVADRFDADSVLNAYQSGFFPMGDEAGVIHWIISDPRFVLPIGGIHAPKSLRRLDRKKPFEFRIDSEFRRVMEHCAADRGGENISWITPRMIEVYCELQRSGFAHSVEAWLGGVLVGGLYGVAIGGAFFGESMFTRRELGGANASKLCLLELERLLLAGGYALLDSQEANEHMSQFGGVHVDFLEYKFMLKQAMDTPARWPHL
jgi:leucyl/phenylalanyl-tRNA---protein transferase